MGCLVHDRIPFLRAMGSSKSECCSVGFSVYSPSICILRSTLPCVVLGFLELRIGSWCCWPCSGKCFLQINTFMASLGRVRWLRYGIDLAKDGLGGGDLFDREGGGLGRELSGLDEDMFRSGRPERVGESEPWSMREVQSQFCGSCVLISPWSSKLEK